MTVLSVKKINIYLVYIYGGVVCVNYGTSTNTCTKYHIIL